MRKLLSLSALFIMALSAFGQQATYDFFFDYKKSTLTEDHNTQLSEITTKFDLSSATVKVKAYCDSVGGASYNVGLGNDRAQRFVTFFKNNKVTDDRISVENNGSTNPLVPNDSPENMAQNRRVIVEIYGSIASAEGAEEAVTDSVVEEAVVADPCAGDTLVQLADGAMFKMNKCEYLKLKDCMTIKAFVSIESIKGSKFSTMGAAGQVMSTAGMVDVRLCADTSLINEITVYVPTDQTCKPAGIIDLWTSYSNDKWNARSKKADTETIGGKSYFVWNTKSSGTANFASEQENTPEFKIKCKKFKMKEITVYYNCEKGAYRVKFSELEKKAKIKLPCPTGVIYFDIVGEDKDGNEVVIKQASSEEIKKKGKQKKCEEKGLKKKYYFYPTASGVKE